MAAIAAVKAASISNSTGSILQSSYHYTKSIISSVCNFVLPKWTTHYYNDMPTLGDLWHQYMEGENKTSIAEVWLKHLDTNGDGTVSRNELITNMNDMLQQYTNSSRAKESWAKWFSREWPLMDWKVGVFLWKSFGGILVVLAICSVTPGRLHGISAKVLRWPLLGLVYFLIWVELLVYVVIRIGIMCAEYLIARPKHRKLRKLMKAANSYDEWQIHAKKLDASQHRQKWLDRVDDETSHEYNWGFILELVKDLRLARENNDSILALAVLQQCTRKNVGGIMSEDLFSYSNTGEPKTIVRKFVSEVVETLHWITDGARSVEQTTRDNADMSSRELLDYEQLLQSKVRDEKTKLFGSLIDATIHDPRDINGEYNENGDHYDANGHGSSSGHLWEDLAPNSNGDSKHDSNFNSKPLPVFHRGQVLMFLKRARAAYGRTAFCMSGGAMLGLYHFGVISALLEAGCLPRIISGTSAGSVIGAIICTRTDEELKRDLQPGILSQKLCCFRRPWKDRIKSVLRNGCMFDFDEWMELIQWFSQGSTTFYEAYQKTGRIFCITLSSTSKKSPPVLLNYLTAPNVTIASAVIASAAVPGFVPPVRLQVKLEDGSVRNQGGEKEQAFWDGSIQQDIPTQGLSEMLNCQFFIASQCNPHIIPFFFNSKGGVGRPSRWSSGKQETSYRGGFLLSALEMYLKTDMKAKMSFLNQMDAAVGPVKTMFIQRFLGSTTIVPSVRPMDYTKLFTDPKEADLDHCFQAGAVAAYGHIPMIKLHYMIADAIEMCVAQLENREDGKSTAEPRAHRCERSDSGSASDWADTAFTALQAVADDEEDI
ncbi:hypothetical protein MPSEU_000574000 [Mayamaea pseudoterrestris]|nr:hypothetical protein MPSEU_000574000 [Mayamaea pseudoterrestris]